MKKDYVPPKMTVIEMTAKAPLLSCSANDNPYWGGCWEGPTDDYWKKDD